MLLSVDHYYLFQAYELLGHWLYGREWTGSEYSYRDEGMLSPEQLAARRRPMEEGIERANREIASLGERIRKTVKADEIESAQQSERRCFETRAKLLAALYELPEPDESYRHSFAMLERRRVTEGRLIEALRKGDLAARAAFGIVIPAEKWNDASDFRFNIELSLVIFPRGFSSLRRASVTLPRPGFDGWLSEQIPVVPDPTHKIAPDVLCRDFLRSEVAKGKTMSRDKYRAEALKLFPGLTMRRFTQLWSEIAPRGFKLPGRPKGAKKSTR